MRSSPRLLLREVNLRLLAHQLAHDERPRWRELALTRAGLGLLGDVHLRRAARAALEALGARSNLPASWRFAWAWWLQAATHGLHGYQADRLTPQWCAAHVSGTPNLPPGGAVLLSVHHFNQRLAWVRFSSAVERLGVLTLFDHADTSKIQMSPGRHSRISVETSAQKLAVLFERTFSDRVYCPPHAAGKALRLLQDGGYVIITPDGYLGRERGVLFGRNVGLGPGAAWLARRAEKPIVPFSIAPHGKSWRLWCGAAFNPTERTVELALEECIRQAPTNWMLWPNWFDSPPAHAR